MTKNKLETKAMKAVIHIDKTLSSISDVLNDLSMKLCYIIKDKRNYYDMLHGNDYMK
jgi:hypothetical protein